MIPCTIRQLEVFVAAAEIRHFGRTAGALGISQPAVTKQIATLERQIGKTLFVRRRGATPVLSRDGLTFLDHARKLLAQVESLNAHCTAAGEPSLVRVASGAHLLNDCVRPWLPEFARANSSVMITCSSVESSTAGLRLLDEGQADLLIYTMAQRQAPGFQIDVVRPVRLSLYGSPSCQALRNASPEEISELPFVLPPPGSEGERIVLDGLTEAGVFCSRVVLRQQYSEVAKQLVVGGVGVAVLLDTMAAAEFGRGELVRFNLELPTLYRAICRRERSAGVATIDAVATALREAMLR